jgi:aminopeptidase N
MVDLWSGTFELGSTLGLHRVFRAHEVAHQWWGIGVGYKTYHDQWLSEGFSTYFGGWYLQAVQRDNELFFKLLTSWRLAILRNRDYLLGKGREAGPIWLGSRTLSADTRNDLDLIIYRKSALVLHMLRNMLLDLETLKEDQFRGLLSGFYREYRNTRASTMDFQAYTEKYLGADMGWFFNQWVYGTAIPFYQYARTTVQTDSGYVVRCRIVQQGVPPAFRMFLPIQVTSADGTVMRVRVLVTGEKVECDLPPMKSEPVEVVFNYLDSVLSSGEEVDW